MQADFAVELGRDDETLDVPWTSPEERLRYYDLKHDPQLLDQIEEAVQNPALRDFLMTVNASASLLESAKCDTWTTQEMNPEEEIFGLPWKFGSYVDLLFAASASRFSFADHESLLKELSALLKHAPEIPASGEFLLRRCRYHENEGIRDGYYVTFYLFGYGEDEGKARRQWEIALKLVSNAIGQSSSHHPSL
jgi:hypothetical protein